MGEKLKKYRKSNGFSKKKMAKKLGISVDEYKQIENGGDIDNKLKKKIKRLLKNDSEKSAEIKIPKYITDVTKPIDRLANITKIPVLKIIDKLNSPLNKVPFFKDITSTYKSPTTIPNYLKEFNKTPGIEKGAFETISSFYKPLKEVTDKQLRAYQGIQAIFDVQPESVKSVMSIQESLLASITKPADVLKSISDPSIFQSLTKTIIKNRVAYEDYINFSSQLAKTLSNSAITSSMYSTWVTADSFLKTDKYPSILDILSGSSFTLFDDTDTFKEEHEIIEQINNDPKLKEQADNFFDELNQIIKDNNTENVPQERIENLYSKFVLWVSETFQKSEFDSKKIAQKLIKIFPYISLTIVLSLAYINSEAHKKTQKELEGLKAIVLSNNVNADNERKELLKLNQEIHDKFDSEFSQNMVAIKDTHLRTRRSSKAKILGKVSALQEVIVLNKKVKWMEIIYVDVKDKKPKTGWVWVECFKP